MDYVSATYTLHLTVHSALPPIMVHFHPHASQDIMINAIDQCFQVYLRNSQLPVVELFISSDKTSKSFFDPFVQLQSKLYLYHLPNTVRSCKCLLISERFHGQGAPEDENSNKLRKMLPSSIFYMINTRLFLIPIASTNFESKICVHCSYLILHC